MSHGLHLVDVFTDRAYHGNPLAVVVDGDRLAFRAPPLVRSGPLPQPEMQRLARRLGLDPTQVVDAAWVDNGPGWVGLLVADADTVLAVDGASVGRASGEVGAYLGVVGPYPAARPQTGADPENPAFELRAFFPSKGVTVEDPVTGSLNASVAQWLIGSGRATAPYVASQGTALGRSGRVFVTQDDEGEIWIGGQVTRCASGTVAL